MRKISGFIGKFFQNTISRVASIVIILAIISFGVFFIFNSEEEVDTSYIIAKLENSSELTTMKLNYTGMTEYKDSGIKIINRSDFVMVYDATARVGIDVKEIKVEVDNIKNIVWLTIPKARILDVKVDAGNIKYFDEKFALFNVDSKEDANKAIYLAEQGAYVELVEMGILEMADGQAETLLKGLLRDVVPKNYEIKVR